MTDSAHMRSSQRLRIDISKPSAQKTPQVGEMLATGGLRRSSSAQSRRGQMDLIDMAGERWAFPGVDRTEHERVESPQVDSSSSISSGSAAPTTRGASNLTAWVAVEMPMNEFVAGSRQKWIFLQSRPNLQRARPCSRQILFAGTRQWVSEDRRYCSRSCVRPKQARGYDRPCPLDSTIVTMRCACLKPAEQTSP